MQDVERLGGSEPAVASTFAQMQKEFGGRLQGMLLAGSRAYGTPRPHSDYDLQVVADVTLPQRRLGRSCGHWIDLSIKAAQHVRGDFDKPGIAEMFALGKTVFDPFGIVADLRREARVVLDTPMPPPPMSARPFARVSLQQLLHDAVDMLDNGEPAAANYAMTALLHALVTELAAHEGRWAGKVSAHLVFLKKYRPEFFRYAIVAAGPEDPPARISALQTLLEMVFSETPLPDATSGAWTERPTFRVGPRR